MKLKNKDIERLVEKYYDGSSSEQEELLLKANAEQNEHFHQRSIKTQFETMKSLQNEAELDISFDERIMKEIKNSSSKTIIISKSFYQISGIVASIAAIIIIWFGVEMFKPSEPFNTVSDPVIAFQETRKVLEEVSSKLNKGLEAAQKTVITIDKNINKTQEVKKMTNAFEKAKSLQKIDKASKFLQSISKVYVDLGNS